MEFHLGCTDVNAAWCRLVHHIERNNKRNREEKKNDDEEEKKSNAAQRWEGLIKIRCYFLTRCTDPSFFRFSFFFVMGMGEECLALI